MPAQQHIVILGGGFGGVYTAMHLQKLTRHRQDVRITLISRDNYFLMTPLLFEAGSGVLEPRHAVNPIRPLFQRVNFIEADVQGVDFDRRAVLSTLSSGKALETSYDQIVIALGSVTNTSIVPGSDTAMTFKTLADGIAVRNHVIDAFERADVEADPQRRQSILRIVVVGGGLVGTELVGELTEFIHHAHRLYPNISVSDINVHLIEAGPRLMPEMDADLAVYAAEVLRARGVDVRTGVGVERIEPDRVHIKGGESLTAETIVVATGIRANPLLASLHIDKDPRGRIAVDGTMRSNSRPEVWALGDNAMVPDPSGKPYPPLAQHALRQAKVLSSNILAAIDGKPLQPFIYETLGTLASLGRFKGVGRVWKFKLRGFPAWWVWRTYYLMQMPRFNRRIRIMMDWTVALLFKHDVVKLDLCARAGTDAGGRNLMERSRSTDAPFPPA